MATKSPLTPISEPHHFSDYGFDPQIDYFEIQAYEEGRKSKREPRVRSIDTLHFKLQKPDSSKKKRPSPATAAKSRRWWKTALVFLKPRWARPVNPASISGPIYVTQSLCGSNAPFPAAASRSPARISLNVDLPHCISAHSHMQPICLVA